MAKGNRQKPANGSALEFEVQLWAVADKMRGHIDASEYKHVVLGLIFLKYISDAFEEKRAQLLFGFSDSKSDQFIKDEPERAAAAESRDEYLAPRVFWLPKEARWYNLKAKAKLPEMGKLIDDATGAIERENPTLKGLLPRDYARRSLDEVRPGGLVNSLNKLPFLLGKTTKPIRTWVVQQGISGPFGIREGDWTFIPANADATASGMGLGACSNDPRFAAIIRQPLLFDLAKDPDEQTEFRGAISANGGRTVSFAGKNRYHTHIHRKE